MKNNVKFITKLVFVLLILLIISACGNNEDELEENVEVHEEYIM